MNLVNLTPHSITVRFHPTAVSVTFPASGTVARIKRPNRVPPHVDLRVGECLIPLFPPPLEGEEYVEGLPEPRPETMYIVSGEVFSHLPERTDLLRPATSPEYEPYRDEAGRIEAVRGFVFQPVPE